MKIDIIFDTVCPWCFIGKKRLEMALAARPHIQVKQNWKPFLLNPEMPPGGIDQTAYLIKKFGSQARINHMYGTLDEAGQSVEIDFAFDRISKTPNSISSHRLLLYAGRHGPVDSVVEALFVEFFIKGRDTGDTDVLVEIGAGQNYRAANVAAREHELVLRTFQVALLEERGITATAVPDRRADNVRARWGEIDQ